MTKTTLYLYLSITLVLLLSGCVDNTSKQKENHAVTRSPTGQQKIQPEEPMSAEQPGGVRAVGTIELPAQMIAPAIADLAARTGAPEQAIRVLRAIPVIWNNGARGCPQPGQSYTQGLVPGHWLVLEHDGRIYSYHGDGKGVFRLCKNARPTPGSMPPHGRYNTDV